MSSEEEHVSFMKKNALIAGISGVTLVCLYYKYFYQSAPVNDK